MEVKWLLLRSVTLGQAGRFHIEWTSWNLPGGPQCRAVKPEPAGLSQLLDRVQRDVSMAGRLRWQLSGCKPDAQS